MMVSLQKLGIEFSYDPNKPERLHYSISINPDKLRNPKKAREYFTRIIDAVSKNASKKDGLDNLTLSIINNQYLKDLQSTTQELLSIARKHKEIRKEYIAREREEPNLPIVLVLGGGIVGGLAGLVLGYEYMTKWATYAAEYMNNASHLWAPITGVIQSGISIFGTAGVTMAGYLGGTLVGGIASFPYIMIQTHLADRVKRYQSLEQALSQVESNPKETA